MWRRSNTPERSRAKSGEKRSTKLLDLFQEKNTLTTVLQQAFGVVSTLGILRFMASLRGERMEKLIKDMWDFGVRPFETTPSDDRVCRGRLESMFTRHHEKLLKQLMHLGQKPRR